MKKEYKWKPFRSGKYAHKEYAQPAFQKAIDNFRYLSFVRPVDVLMTFNALIGELGKRFIGLAV